MANIQIPNMPPVIALSGEELLEGVQAGSSVRISMGQIIAASAVGLPTTLPIPITAGGTGATTDAGARSNLGLGTIAIQDANSVVLTGGSINATSVGGITPASGAFTSVTTPAVTSTGAITVSTNGAVKQTYNTDNVILSAQGAPTVLNGSTTLTAAQIATGIIQYTGASNTLTLPLGTALDTYYSANVDMAFDFSIIHTGSGNVTIGVNTGVTSIGSLATSNGNSSRWRLRRTGIATWIIYRIS
jgi:hypothetical protein